MKIDDPKTYPVTPTLLSREGFVEKTSPNINNVNAWIKAGRDVLVLQKLEHQKAAEGEEEEQTTEQEDPKY